MLRSVNDVHGYTIHATDGELGAVDDFLFDDETWTVRYMVANTGSWLLGRLVLISPISLGTVDWEAQKLHVRLTRQQVEQSPDITTDQPISRELEARYFDYYGYPPYWSGPYLWGLGLYPAMMGPPGGLVPSLDRTSATQREVEPLERPTRDPHLHSAREVTRYTLQARDGELGHVADLLLDDATWSIRYLVVDTKTWWPGKHVLVAPQWLAAVEWSSMVVRVDLTREAIRMSPEYDPAAMLNRPYEAALYQHYGRAPYWEEA